MRTASTPIATFLAAVSLLSVSTLGCLSESEAPSSLVGSDPASAADPSSTDDDQDGDLSYLQNGTASYTGATDTFLSQASPTANAGTSVTVRVDADNPSGTRKAETALLRFDLKSIPVGSKVTAATFTVNVTNRTSGAGYNAFALSRAWSESKATWNEADQGKPWAAPGARGASDRSATVMGTLTPTVTGKVAIKLTTAGIAVVQGWVNNPATNFGFVIDSTNNADGLGFDSSNATTVATRPDFSVAFTPPANPASPYPVYTTAEVDAWSTSSPEYTRLANSWAGNVNRAYAEFGTQISSVERDILKDESGYIKVQAVLWAADGNPARRDKVIALLNTLRPVTSWEWDKVEQYRLVAGWAVTNLAQAAAIVGYKDPEFTRFLVNVCYPILDWTGGGNWHASFADSKLAIATYLGDAALYTDAKNYFNTRIAQSFFHSKYDGNKIVPLRNASGAVMLSITLNHWGGNWGVSQINSDFTFTSAALAVDGANAERTRDLSHVSMGMAGWMHAARTIVAHGDKLEPQAYDRLLAGYTVHSKRVLATLTTGSTPAPVPVNGNGGNGYLQSWYGARKLFGAATPADVVTLCNRSEISGYPPAGANHTVAEQFADAL